MLWTPSQSIANTTTLCTRTAHIVKYIQVQLSDSHIRDPEPGIWTLPNMQHRDRTIAPNFPGSSKYIS